MFVVGGYFKITKKQMESKGVSDATKRNFNKPTKISEIKNGMVWTVSSNNVRSGFPFKEIEPCNFKDIFNELNRRNK